MAGPCSGLVVLDFSWGMAGGLATAVFADFGADVLKIEPPAGDPSGLIQRGSRGTVARSLRSWI